MKKIIILLGIPGSGKGTQAKKIAERYGYAHISTGNIFRAVLEDPNADKKIIKAIEGIKQGKMVKDSVVYKLAFREIEKKMKEYKGVVLDGAVRSVKQAKKYQKFFKKMGWDSEVLVLEIEISNEIGTERLLKRHEGRSDDKKAIINKRMEDQGNKHVKPVVNFYIERGLLETIDGNKEIEVVASYIKKILEKKYGFLDKTKGSAK